jgi:hypothetical protein
MGIEGLYIYAQRFTTLERRKIPQRVPGRYVRPERFRAADNEAFVAVFADHDSPISQKSPLRKYCCSPLLVRA